MKRLTLLAALAVAMLETSCQLPVPVARPVEAPPIPLSDACLQGNDYGERDERGGMTKDPYRYRREIASQNWSDFVDGYLHGFSHASGR